MQDEAERPPVDLKIFRYQSMGACLRVSQVAIDQDTGRDARCGMRDAMCGGRVKSTQVIDVYMTN
jgi:hypothetical protein